MGTWNALKIVGWGWNGFVCWFTQETFLMVLTLFSWFSGTRRCVLMFILMQNIASGWSQSSHIIKKHRKYHDFAPNPYSKLQQEKLFFQIFDSVTVRRRIYRFSEDLNPLRIFFKSSFLYYWLLEKYRMCLGAPGNTQKKIQ